METLHDSSVTAVESQAIGLNSQHVPAALIGGGLDGTTYYTVQVKTASGWEDLYQDGSVVQVTDTNKVVGIYAPGTYRGVKTGAAASSLSVAK